MKKVKQKKTDKSPLKIIFLSLYVVFAAIYLPVSTVIDLGMVGTTVLAYTFCALSFFAIAFAASSFKSALGYGISVFVLIFIGFTPSTVAMLSSFVSGACIYAYLLIRQRTPILYGIPAIAPIAVVIITRQPTMAIFALLWIPASLLLVYAFKKRLDRVSAICHVSFGICLAVVLVLALVVFATYGALTLTSIRAFVETVRSTVVAAMNELFNEMLTAMQIDGSEYFDPSYIELTVTAVLYVVPALIVTVANVCAYIMHATLISVCYSKKEDNKEALAMLAFDMSLASAIFFLLSGILATVLASGNTAIYAAMAANIAIILAPGLILTTLAALKALTSKNGPSCFGSLVYFGVIFMLCSFSPIAIIVCAIAGAVLIIMSRVAKWRAESNKD